MDYKEAIEILRKNKPTSDPRKCGKELCTACDVTISATQELQALHEQGFSLERLKDIDFRKDVIEHINYYTYMGFQEELEEYQQLGTLEEVREAVEKQSDCKHCGYKIHSDNITKLNSCNDCGLKSTCKKRPKHGEYCRINCYDWSVEE